MQLLKQSLKLIKYTWVKPKELQKLEDAVMNEGKYAVNPAIVGHSAMEIAKISRHQGA